MTIALNPRLLNEYVCISRLPDGSFHVTCGSRSDEARRYVFGGFHDVDAAIAWVEDLDRRAAQAANLNAKDRPGVRTRGAGPFGEHAAQPRIVVPKPASPAGRKETAHGDGRQHAARHSAG